MARDRKVVCKQSSPTIKLAHSLQQQYFWRCGVSLGQRDTFGLNNIKEQ